MSSGSRADAGTRASATGVALACALAAAFVAAGHATVAAWSAMPVLLAWGAVSAGAAIALRRGGPRWVGQLPIAGMFAASSTLAWSQVPAQTPAATTLCLIGPAALLVGPTAVGRAWFALSMGEMALLWWFGQPPEARAASAAHVSLCIAMAVGAQGIVEHLLAQPARTPDPRERSEPTASTSETLQTVLAELPLAAALKGPDGRLLMVNRAYEDVTSVRAEQALGRNEVEIHGEAFGAPWLADDLGALESGESSRTELHAVGGDGHRRRLAAGRVVVPDGDERVLVHWLEEPQPEERLELADELTELQTLVGSVAHDMNNLLATVSGYARSIATGRHPERVAGDAGTILQSAARAVDLVRNVQAHVQGESRPSTPCDAIQALRESAQFLTNLVAPAATLELVLPDAEQAWVGLSASDLDRVMTNLCANAREAVSAPGHIQIAVSLDEAAVLITVSDDGHGFPPEDAERIFQPFVSSRKQAGGTGIGLLVVRSLVRARGGSVTAESSGRGATFRIRLPRGGTPALARHTPATELSVLVVDDDPDILELSSEAFRSHGHAVRCAASGAEALAVLERHASELPDVLVTDVAMPGMDGVALAEHCAERFPELPVLFLTGELGRVRAYANRTSTPVLAKPFRATDLVRTARSLAGRTAV